MDRQHAKAYPCVRSGYCCKRAPCAFGEWDEVKQQCRFLEIEEQTDLYTIHRCGKYDEIKSKPEAYWWVNPAFGAGCSSPLFNNARDMILRHRPPPDESDETDETAA